jgi:YD repeat-containing protein
MIARRQLRGFFARAAASLLLMLSFLDAAFAQQSQQSFFDAAGQLIAVIDATVGSAQYSYDATGNILAITRNPASTLVVVQFTPSGAPVGATVNIYGTAFGTTANTTVSFNGATATPSAVTATAITVTVPSGATSGPLTVTSPAGTVTVIGKNSALAPASSTPGAPRPIPPMPGPQPLNLAPKKTADESESVPRASSFPVRRDREVI